MAKIEDFSNITKFDNKTVTIAISTDTSDALDVFNTSIVGIEVPASMTGTRLDILVSDTENGTYIPYRDNASLSPAGADIDASAARYGIKPNDTQALRFIKLLSNATETAERVIKIIIKGGGL